RIGDAQHDPFAVFEDEQPLRPVAGVDREVRTQAEGAELIDPGVVAGLGAPRRRHALELRQRLRIERPPFGTMLAGSGRTVERPFTLPAVEAREVATREGRPVDAVPIHVSAPRRDPLAWLARLIARQRVQFPKR